MKKRLEKLEQIKRKVEPETKYDFSLIPLDELRRALDIMEIEEPTPEEKEELKNILNKCVIKGVHNDSNN